MIGPELAVRTSETLHGWRLSLEFGAEGRSIRLALSTDKGDVGVLLDEYHARLLSHALGQLARNDTDPVRNWAY